MNKAETASYLVSIHTLLEAQSKGSHSIPSQVLAQEYEREWVNLKNLINEDKQDETGHRPEQSRVDEGRADQPSGLTGSGVSVRNSRGEPASSGASVQRPRV